MSPLVEDDGNEVLVSAGSPREIAIKLSLDKLGMPIPFEEAFPAQLVSRDAVFDAHRSQRLW